MRNARADYLQRVDDMLQLAAAARDEAAKVEFLRLADEYDELAAKAARKSKRR